MIDFLDKMIRHLFASTIADITDGDTQIGFEPPNEDWRTYVAGLKDKALNVYLVDLRENRVLRSNERVRGFQNGVFAETPAPRKMDCHYLISAWSPARASLPAVEPTVDEHALLYKATASLMDAEPLIASEIYGPGGLPAGFPDIIADVELPSIVLPVDGFPKLAEFWGATKTVHWKPAVYVIITLPVVLDSKVAGPIVTTRITNYRVTGSSRIETLIQIGGTVLSGTNPVPSAWVRIEDNAGVLLVIATTDANGRFTFAGLAQGNYTLRVRAPGFAEATRLIQVPSPTGEYDISV
jgi:hypothetical protein